MNITTKLKCGCYLVQTVDEFTRDPTGLTVTSRVYNRPATLNPSINNSHIEYLKIKKGMINCSVHFPRTVIHSWDIESNEKPRGPISSFNAVAEVIKQRTLSQDDKIKLIKLLTS